MADRFVPFPDRGLARAQPHRLGRIDRAWRGRGAVRRVDPSALPPRRPFGKTVAAGDHAVAGERRSRRHE